MPVGAALGTAAASLGGAAIQSNAASKAAKAQSQAAAQARQDMLPYVTAGYGGIRSLAQLYGINPETGEADPNQAFNEASLAAFRRSPDYQFALQEGLGALNNSQAAKGMLRSGNTLRAITDYGQGLATQTFNNYRGALGQLASIGAGAASGAGQASMAQGAAQASGIVGGANAWSGALGNLANYGMMNYQQQQQQQYLQGLLRSSSYGTPALQSYSPGYAYSNPTGYTAPTAPIGTGIWPS